MQAEEKRQAKMQKLVGSRDALRHRIHNHLQQQAAALQEVDSKVSVQPSHTLHNLLQCSFETIELQSSVCLCSKSSSWPSRNAFKDSISMWRSSKSA